MTNSANIFALLAGIIVAILQVVVSPFLNLFGATPNFIFAYLVAFAILFTDKTHYVSAFLLGSFFDFSQGSTVGAWMLLLVLSTIVLRGFAENLDSNNVVSQLVFGIVICVIFNLLHMLILILTTAALSLSALISSGVMWSFLLDSVAFVVFYVVFRLINIKFAKKSAFGGYI